MIRTTTVYDLDAGIASIKEQQKKNFGNKGREVTKNSWRKIKKGKRKF